MTLVLRLVAVISTFGLAVIAGPGQMNPSGARNENSIVTVGVTDKNDRLISGLTKQDFSATVDKRPVAIDYFKADDSPASIILLLDTSAAIREYQAWDEKANPLTRLLEVADPRSQFLLVTFNATTVVATDWTTDRATITNAIANAEMEHRKKLTAFYDACIIGIQKAAEAPTGRKYIVLIAPGIDTNSKASRNEFHRLLQESAPPFYCVALEDAAHDSLGSPGREEMSYIATTTGGRIIFPGTSQEVARWFELAAQWLRRSYRIGLDRTALPKDGKFHKLHIRINLANGADSRNFLVNARKTISAGN